MIAGISVGLTLTSFFTLSTIKDMKDEKTTCCNGNELYKSTRRTHADPVRTERMNGTE